MPSEHLEQKIRDMVDPYAVVVATAREARRMNAILFHAGGNKDETEQVTTEAPRRMVRGDVGWQVDDMTPEDAAAKRAKSGGGEGKSHSFEG